MVTLGPPEIESIHGIFDDFQEYMDSGEKSHEDHAPVHVISHSKQI